MAQPSSSFCVCKPWYTKQSQLTTCIKATIKSYSFGDDDLWSFEFLSVEYTCNQGFDHMKVR
jgi:hypothetical protein